MIAGRYCMEIATALEFLHSRAIVHCDIRSDSISLAQSASGTVNALVVDNFYLSKKDRLFELCGAKGMNPDFVNAIFAVPPENRKQRQPYTPSGDVFAFGMVLFELLSLQVPYSELPAEAKEAAIANGQVPNLPEYFLELRRAHGLPKEEDKQLAKQYNNLIDLMEDCLNVDAAKRPNIKKILK